jgi:hypothetical protein
MIYCPDTDAYVRIARYTPELWQDFSGLGRVHQGLLGRVGVVAQNYLDLRLVHIQHLFPPGDWFGTTWVTEWTEVEPATEDEWVEQQLLDELQK